MGTPNVKPEPTTVKRQPGLRRPTWQTAIPRLRHQKSALESRLDAHPMQDAPVHPLRSPAITIDGETFSGQDADSWTAGMRGRAAGTFVLTFDPFPGRNHKKLSRREMKRRRKAYLASKTSPE